MISKAELFETAKKLSHSLLYMDLSDNLELEKSVSHYLIELVEIGGVSGGSCWDESNAEPYCIYNDEWFPALDVLISEICPSIYHADYKQIVNMVNVQEATEHEYYGNCTDYKIYSLDLDKLYEFLSDL